MAAITINIPLAGINAFRDRFGYQATINGLPNPQTTVEFTRIQIASWVKSQIREHITNTAAAVASSTAGLDVDANIPIT